MISINTSKKMKEYNKSKKYNNKFIGLILSIIFLILSSTALVSAATGLNVVLSNQNPDPVEPGNFVYLNVKVSNAGSDSIKDAKIVLIENQNFNVAQGETNEKNLGTIPAFSSLENSNSFIIAKYKVLVDERTPTGMNTISFSLKTSAGTYNYDFDLLVQDSNPLIEVKSIIVPKVEPGKNVMLDINLKNINNIDLKNIKTSLSLNEIENNIITTNTGSNEQIIEIMKSGEEKKLSFDVSISPEAQSLPYLLPIKLSYKDTLGNSFENTLYASIKVYSKPDLSITVDSQEIYTQGKGKITLAIANPGSSKIKGVQIQILNSTDYNVIEGENQYIGDLNPDDFQTLLTQVYINNPEKATLKVKVSYSDSYDEKKEEIIELPLKIYNDAELAEFGFVSSNGSIFNSMTIIALIFGIIVGYVICNIRNKRKKKNTR